MGSTTKFQKHHIIITPGVIEWQIYVGNNCSKIHFVGQTLFLAENSEIVIFAIFLVFECNFLLLKKGMHWLGPGSKIGLNEKLGKFKET